MTSGSSIRSRRPAVRVFPVWPLPLLFTAAALLGLPAVMVRAQAPGAGTAVMSPAPAPERASCDVILAKMGPNKIMVIKQVRDSVPGLGLADAKALVESAPKLIKRGVTKAEAETIKQRVEAAGATVTIEVGGTKMLTEPTAAPTEATAKCDVILTEMGPNKISVIKEVRAAVPGLGLAEAKMLVESAPRPLKEGVTRQEAAAIKERVEAAGATVIIREGP